MKSILLYLRIITYIITLFPKRIKINSFKKQGKIEEADALVEKILVDWSNYVVKTIGIKLQVTGIENLPKENCLFVGNHQGFMDIPLIVSAINRMTGFIAKKELLKMKIISSWMKEIHCVFMDRSNIRESIKSINEGVEILKSGYNMVIFPEGTRSKGQILGEFKKGSMKLALKSGVPVVPIAIDGSYKILEANRGMLKPDEVKVHILKPIDVKDITKEEQQNLSQLVRVEIEKALIELRKS